MDLGTVSDCGGYGPVSSENGDYVCGVCGLSLSSIRHSYAKCTLTGRKYVGGIWAPAAACRTACPWWPSPTIPSWAAGGGTLLLAAGAVLLLRRRAARKKRTPAGE